MMVPTKTICAFFLRASILITDKREAVHDNRLTFAIAAYTASAFTNQLTKASHQLPKVLDKVASASILEVPPRFKQMMPRRQPVSSVSAPPSTSASALMRKPSSCSVKTKLERLMLLIRRLRKKVNRY